MSFAFFLRGFLGALVVFAVVTYVATQSFWTTLINTAICAVIIQAGYFVAILLMVWRSPARGKAGAQSREEPTPAAAKKGRGALR